MVPVNTGALTTVTFVGSSTAWVAGSSVGTPPGIWSQATFAWLAMTVPSTVGVWTVASNTRVAWPPGATVASAGVVAAFQVIFPPPWRPPRIGCTWTRCAGRGLVTTTLLAAWVPVFLTTRV